MTRTVALDRADVVAPPPSGTAPLAVSIAVSADDIAASQALRFRVFADELGASIDTAHPGLDVDPYDQWCHHILVRDQETGQVVASTRVLLEAEARLAGGFYSESEFDLSAFRRQPGKVMEIGRTCVHPDYRSGSAISMLWSGLARHIDIREHRYMIGCASVPLGMDGMHAMAVYKTLKERYLLAEECRVVPHLPLHERNGTDQDTPLVVLPPLLKAYLRLGARIGGPPCRDPLFDCADLFIVLTPADIQRRYAKHFLRA